jgi:hypothetical protein
MIAYPTLVNSAGASTSILRGTSPAARISHYSSSLGVCHLHCVGPPQTQHMSREVEVLCAAIQSLPRFLSLAEGSHSAHQLLIGVYNSLSLSHNVLEGPIAFVCVKYIAEADAGLGVFRT